MKKRIISSFLVLLILSTISACGAKTQKTEYNVDELGPAYQKSMDLFQEESSDFKDEDLNSDKGIALFKQCSEKNGLPFNQEITLTGFKAESLQGFSLDSTDGKYHIYCDFPNDENNLSLFIKHGTEVTVTGTMSQEGYPYGELIVSKILTPEDVTPKFESNVAQALDSDLLCSVVQGTVSKINTLDQVEGIFLALCPDKYERQDYYYDTILTLTDGGTEKLIYMGYDPEQSGEIHVGDKIALSGYFDFKYLSSDDPSFGYMNNIYDIYIFDK